jgi:hypothetical protein
MSTIGAVKAFTATLTTGSTSTSAIDLAGGYGKIMVGIPTMTSGCDHYFQVGDTATGTFRRLYHPSTVATAKPTVVVVASSVTNCYVPLDVNGQFLKIEVTTAASDTSHTYKFICSPN